MPDDRVVVVGAGIGGMASAIYLAAQGHEVEIVERATRSGGKMRECAVGDAMIDSGPTVFTMRWVFEELFAAANASLDDFITLEPLEILARHAWSGGERFDLFADVARATEAVAAFSGPEEGRRFLAFCNEAKAIYRTLKEPFLTSNRPGPLGLTNRIGLQRLPELLAIRPFETLWGALSKQLHDPRLRQLFGRYATYVGSSPFLAPATLMLIAHVEQDGVWAINGGMQRLGDALERLAVRLGVTFRFGQAVKQITVERGVASGVVLASGERLKASAVIVNADAAALAAGEFGKEAAIATEPVGLRERSLSAMTWALQAETDGFPLLRHNVFFSSDYAAEFRDLFSRARLPAAPTIYVCAQDRHGSDGTNPVGPERLFVLINAPPTGDVHHFDLTEVAACETQIFSFLRQCGLILSRRGEAVATTPTDFNRLFPATGGALYGRASHGWMASFRRPSSQTAIPGLYLAGGSTHPGAGVPMAVLSGRLAALRLISDRASTSRSRRAAISGGTSMR